ncbi:hypothetical protein BX070DRAFT_192716 [Coemansia spiralis]|nr:hypothetical protein BX070DRAFT_192716 [Coemansia spiralis]
MNKVILIGNVGADPKEIELPNGKKLAALSLATSQRYRDKEGNLLEQTAWHKIKFAGDAAERAVRLIKKGAVIQVDGSLRYNQFTNKDGVDVNVAEVLGSNFNVVFFAKHRTPGEENEEQGQNNAAEED